MVGEDVILFVLLLLMCAGEVAVMVVATGLRFCVGECTTKEEAGEEEEGEGEEAGEEGDGDEDRVSVSSCCVRDCVDRVPVGGAGAIVVVSARVRFALSVRES